MIIGYCIILLGAHCTVRDFWFETMVKTKALLSVHVDIAIFKVSEKLVIHDIRHFLGLHDVASL